MVKPLEGALYAAVGGVSSALVAATIVYPNLWRDIKIIRRAREPTSRLKEYLSAEPPVTTVDRFLHQVQLQPDKPFLLFEDEVYTYRDMDIMSNKVANFFRGEGYRCGDTVAMLIYNEPAFIWTFLGLAKLGVKMAFLNTNLRTKSLLHCFQVAETKTLIVGKGENLLDATLEILAELQEEGATIWLLGDKVPPKGFLSLDDRVKGASDEPIPFKLRETITANDPICYIYTSGTTGLPKAVLFSHRKMLSFSMGPVCAGLRRDEIMYVVLPLYHSNAFGMMGGVIEQGATLALSRKFSASQFWDDCRKYNASMIPYIGELLRYLCLQPKRPNDRQNNVRLAIGNGLRPDVWGEFQDRFGVPEIVETYGASEGNVFFINLTNKKGSIGVASPLLKKLGDGPVFLLQVDPDTYKPIRDKNGRCTEVNPGEPGLLVAPIADTSPFDGYKANKQQTDKKILRDVFEDGDMFFDSGDLLKRDKDYNLYFVDRLGDTFRWKGENVATTEVAEVLHEMEGVQEVNVYGVKVPGQDGRAGMAAIVYHPGHQVNLPALFAHLSSRLPPYARPIFLRLSTNADITSTFKYKKVDLVKEGFDPTIVSDPLYVRENQRKTFVTLDIKAYKRIVEGKAKL
ncbi:very long-chain acyl-CoA synthetase-like isoform X1 [Branchiostoma floridae]|uniref:long-chain-fatty-acid--CoA ligase n=1 Tax=Branchiostoma floridae TaxID=7739 RepID=A0A9J7KPK5_BRAFL|nr:very long-chain acyl-CoA synthetase-like isoform X1 [Branchiostoma floridae]